MIGGIGIGRGDKRGIIEIVFSLEIGIKIKIRLLKIIIRIGGRRRGHVAYIGHGPKIPPI